MAKAIDKRRKEIAEERARSLKKKKVIDSVLEFSKTTDGSDQYVINSTVSKGIKFNAVENESRYIVAKDITIYHEGSIMNDYGYDHIVAKGSIANAISIAKEHQANDDLETIIVNANHTPYEWDYSAGYIGDIPVDSLRIEVDENGRAMLKADIYLLKEHSLVKDLFVQNQDISVSIEIKMLEYSFRRIDDNGKSVDDEDEDANSVLVLEKFSIHGLAIVAYPRIASTTNQVKIKDIKEDNEMSKELKKKAEELKNSEAENQENQDEQTQAEETEEEDTDSEATNEETQDEQTEQEETEEAEATEEEAEQENSLENIENSFNTLKTEKEQLENSFKELENKFTEAEANRVKAEAEAAELKNSIEELNKKFTAINSSAKIEDRSANKDNANQGYAIKQEDLDAARGIKKENK